MEVRREGLYCRPADAYIDPTLPVARAIITHGHADHARAGHGEVWATPGTLGIMRVRYGDDCAVQLRALEYGEPAQLTGGVALSLVPAGHIYGSAQAVLDYDGGRIVISGDYKRALDPTCEPFQVVHADVFVTEATFGLPVFQHPPIATEVQKLLDSLQLNSQRCHLVGCYALGKCQRLILTLRALGYHEPIYLHGAQIKLCEFYQRAGFDLGEWRHVTDVKDSKLLAGKIVLAPPSALQDRWARRFPEMLPVLASGWMQIRARARQRLVELPLVISDHCDWSELLQTADDVDAPEVWVTHGRERALVHALTQRGRQAQALSLLGFEDEDGET